MTSLSLGPTTLSLGPHYRGRLGTVLHFAHCVYSQSSSVASLVSATYPSAKQVLLLLKEPTKRGLGLHRDRDLLPAKLSGTIFRRPSADPAVSPNPVRFGEATRTTGDRPRASTATS